MSHTLTESLHIIIYTWNPEGTTNNNNSFQDIPQLFPRTFQDKDHKQVDDFNAIEKTLDFLLI